MKPSKNTPFLDSLDLCSVSKVSIVSECDVILERLFERIEVICMRKDTWNNMIGDIGETFVDLGINWVMSGRYYEKDCSGKKSYSIITHYKSPPASTRGGLDKYLSITNSLGDVYNIGIEVKCWNKVKWISKGIFITNFLDRFRVCGKDDYKVLVATKSIIPHIRERCEENNIRIIPIQHFLHRGIERDEIKASLFSFYRDFNILLDEIIGVDERYDDMSRDKRIRKLYECGRDVKIIAKCYDLSERQIQRIIKDV